MIKTSTLKHDVVNVSDSFKKEVIRSIAAIVFFVVTYILLFALSICLAAASVYGGLALMINAPKLITLIIGVGMMGLGVMVVIFLIKFLFTESKIDETDSIEITEEDQPELVAFIHQTAAETNTPKPKKIFLSSDVNACVYYNSSFWSMFLPVKKNLKIGLGLINALNTSEFKAVLAHEFGHFSQRSMKLGSYVYQVNKIIHDLLFNNSGFSNALSSWSNMNGTFAFFAHITVKIIQAIQWILLQVYKVVNKSYLSLSREMEFHADLVAASISGGNNIISSLKRLEFAALSYDTTIDVYNNQWKENKVFSNVYQDHVVVMENLAQLNNIPVLNGLPVMQAEKNIVPNRVNVKDQWASHPTLKEREEYLSAFGLHAEVNNESPWMLFRDKEKLQEELTKQLYKDLLIDQSKTFTDKSGFELIYKKQLKESSFPIVYNDYFNSRSVEIFNTEVVGELPAFNSLSEILTAEVSELPQRIQVLLQDIDMLKAIEAKELNTKTFDFDGQKYKRIAATEIREKLEKELKIHQEKLKETDIAIYKFFYKKAPLHKAEELRLLYNRYFENKKFSDEYLKEANSILELLQPVYAGATIPIEEINSLISYLKQNHEPSLKNQLQEWLNKKAFDIDSELKNKILNFISNDYQYFSGNSFFDNELVELNEVITGSWNLINQFLFEQFKQLLEWQLQYTETENKHIIMD